MSHVNEKLSAMPATAVPAQPAKARTWGIRRFAGRLSALLSDGGMSDRFAAERARDEGLMRRVEGRER